MLYFLEIPTTSSSTFSLVNGKFKTSFSCRSFLSRAVLFVAIIAIQNLAFSQTAKTIRTGRPGVSIGPYVVGTRVFQVQSGLTYDQFRSQNESESYTFDNVIRYGLNESFEWSY